MKYGGKTEDEITLIRQATISIMTRIMMGNGSMKMMMVADHTMEMTEAGDTPNQTAVGNIMEAMESPSILIPTMMKTRGTLDPIRADHCLVC